MIEMWSKQQILNWFGDRGIPLESRQLKKSCWKEGRLYFVVEGAEFFIRDTEEGMVDVTATHNDEGKPILVYELDDSIPVEESPFAE